MRTFIIFAMLVAGCSGEPLPPANRAPPSPPVSAAASAAPPPLAQADATPTVLTDDERARDEALVPRGGSYGGYLALMALTRQPTLWRAGVDLFGLVNLQTFMRSTDPVIRSMLTEELGDPDKDAVLLQEFSPSRDFAKVVAPLFVYAGANDPRVPRSESDALVAEMRRRSIPVEYMLARNEGHSVDRAPNRVEFMTRVVRFLDEHAR